jgi:hypothetical protein
MSTQWPQTKGVTYVRVVSKAIGLTLMCGYEVTPAEEELGLPAFTSLVEAWVIEPQNIFDLLTATQDEQLSQEMDDAIEQERWAV